jgi:hypothetical protein
MADALVIRHQIMNGASMETLQEIRDIGFTPKVKTSELICGISELTHVAIQNVIAANFGLLL